jgi:hypothetical protein
MPTINIFVPSVLKAIPCGMNFLCSDRKALEKDAVETSKPFRDYHSTANPHPQHYRQRRTSPKSLMRLERMM